MPRGACLLALLLPVAAASQEVVFNRDIRPILSDKCFTCHGPSTKTSLRFDLEASAAKAIVPGDPEASEIIRRISSSDTAKRMPPAWAGRDKLTDTQISTIRRWIAQGAHWQTFWSFIPPKRDPKQTIDSLIRARLATVGLHSSPEADPRTLLRRVTLDLTGLPPTPAETDAFLADRSSNAYEKVVDRLFAYPAYGEHMAFRWMEAARYADTNGYSNDGVRAMWRWRDWVIDAFNHNMPYDEFTIDQLAGDLLPNPTLEQRIATGFNRNHRTSAEGGIVPEEFRVDYAADRTETTATVWMGLTIGCARCHDHKYDPIPQRDYYRLFAYFNSVPGNGFAYNFGNDDPQIKAPTPPQQKALVELEAKVAAAEKRWASDQPAIDRALETFKPAQEWTVDERLDFRQSPGTDHFDGKRSAVIPREIANFEYTDPFTFAAWIKPDSPKGAILSHADDFMEGQGHGLYLIDGKLRLHVIFRWSDLGLRLETEQPVQLHQWQHVAVTYDGKMKASGVHVYMDGREQKVKVLFDELIWPMKGKRPFRIGAGAGLRFDGDIEDVRVYSRELTPAEIATLPLRESVREIAAIPVAKRTQSQRDKLRFCYLETALSPEQREMHDQLLAARKAYDDFLKTVPSVMVMQDMNPPRETFILKRGAYDAHGDKVEPGVPSALPGLGPEWPNNRLGLARWLVDRNNPLTARVTVNRFWEMYFGTGIVKTVQDFGSQGDPPVNQDLLDWLAVEFMESGWDVKALQKKIVMSAAYRQSSNVTPELLQKDPENRYLARGPRLRLGPDIIRDQALAISGLLVSQLGGPSVKPYQPPGLWQELSGGKGYEPDKGEGLYRRSLYTYWRRTVAPPFMMNFDSPTRDVCTVNETRTNTPLQALDLMNDVAFLEAARKFAARMIHEGGSQPFDFAYRVALNRPVGPAETRILKDTFARFKTRYAADPKAAEQYLDAGDSPRDKSIDPAELAAYTATASLILNLDEVITKE